MQITIDQADARPIYRQVADEIRALIAQGELREGAPLPPVRQLAADLGVNMNTIATAYRELQDAGLLAVKHGSGASVTSRQTSAESRPSTADLRRGIRAALTQMVLAGMRRGEIMTLIADELRALLQGAK
ncbi:MAG: GntR family transcriptional regulator [Acidobacteria bacterium]|nr:GntR family transcriptional regulator [Acidobacteriota bacterium]MBI3423829.1 GntR family transcriptional regulator [Acidobacteriota bacterium]